MSELLVLALKFAFLALLWVFILFTGAVIRSDLFGRRVPATASATDAEPASSAGSAAIASGASSASAQAAPAAPASGRPSWLSRRGHRPAPSTLRITKGKQAGLTMALGDQLKIGRSTDCQLILDDDYVSTRHARIFRTNGGYLVEDLGSTNGTYLNNERLSGATAFTTSDTLRIGRTLLVVEG
ncbi:MAG: FHA domain-containing protein [Actinomycetes bacterium]